MAARKSCTHLTWAEAKANTGSAAVKKNKGVLRKQDHGQVLAAKIIAKEGGGVDDRKLRKAYQKQEEKAAAISAKRQEERELKRLASLQEINPYDSAKEKVAVLLAVKATDDIPHLDLLAEGVDLDNEDTQTRIAECKQMQVDELMALEAMIPQKDFVLSDASQLSELREKLLENDSRVAYHPPISFIIQLDIDDYRDTNDDMKLNALVLLRVTLPPLYQSSEGSQTPLWEFEHVMVTDKTAKCSADKPVESLAWLDTNEIQRAMSKYAQEDLLPYPCVYEVAVTWLSENIFEFLNMHPHLLATSES